MNITETLRGKFNEVFNNDSCRLFFSPGRVNLIGEHIDYNGGLVFPCAINLGTYGAAGFNGTNTIRVYSLNFENVGIINIDLNDLNYKKEDNWANYIKGMIKYLDCGTGKINKGFDLIVYGDLPNGAGLSSSASLEMLIGKILVTLFNMPAGPVELALLGKKVENKFMGVNSGIMDQFAISLGKKDHAIALDCNNLDYKYTPLNFKDESIVIMNTNKRRELADSKYNERRSECEAALAKLQNKKDISALCELTSDEFEELSNVIENENELKRARHAVSENERVKKAMTALENDDLNMFGSLMTASHTSLRDDYDVTGKELDTLVSSALKQDGVLGARMTGAGFGGCAIALVKNSAVDNFIKTVGKDYLNAIGYEASFYIANTADGPSQIDK